MTEVRMKAYIISDKDYETGIFHELFAGVESYFKLRDFKLEHTSIGREDLASCIGCFGCWIKKPGECVIPDGIESINSTAMNSDVVIYLSPVIFGQFSANIKDAIDRWLPNMLPFFMIRKDGSMMHPRRYESYPKQIMIGYGNEVDSEDAELFKDITKKHRNNVEAVIFDHNYANIDKLLSGIALCRITGGTL
jgi:multimeric flavodoxin WrbA